MKCTILVKDRESVLVADFLFFDNRHSPAGKIFLRFLDEFLVNMLLCIQPGQVSEHIAEVAR